MISLFDDWIEALWATRVYDGNIRCAFQANVLPVIGAKQVDAVSRSDVLEILRNIERRGSLVMLRKVRMWMGQMFEYELARKHPRIGASTVPSGRLKAFKKATRGHFPAVTSAEDAVELMAAIRRWRRVIPRALLIFSAYVFQRPGEIRFAKWDEFDLKSAKWVIPADRMAPRNEEHWVPLAPQVVDLLRRHQGVVGSHGWLWPSRFEHQPISEATANKALKSMGYEGRHCCHGFRAMARTLIDEELKIDPRFIEKQLAHDRDDSGLGGAYNRTTFWPERVKLMTAWADWLDMQSAQKSSR